MTTPDLQGQRLPIGSVPNIRQLGGYVGAGGRRVRDGLLIRSASLAGLSESDAETLARDYRLADIVDFRTAPEQRRKPDVVPECAVHHSLPAMDEATYRAKTRAAADAGRTGGLERGGDRFLDRVLLIAKEGDGDDLTSDFLSEGPARDAYRGLFDVLLARDGEGAVLWHCSQGKDRAGVASALVLAALGVDEDTIVADYTLSGDAYADVAARARAYAEDLGLDEELTRRLLGYAACGFPDRLRAVLDGLRGTYGSLERYLAEELDLTAEDLGRLRAVYLEHCDGPSAGEGADRGR